MLKKGKEKVQERASKKRSKVWNSFTELPDGSKKAKCKYCGELLSCDSKNGTSHLKRHPCYRSTEPPNKDARTTPPSNSYGNMENHSGYGQQKNVEPSGNKENQLGHLQQTNAEPFGCQDNNLGENHLGYVQPINKEPSGNRENPLGYLQPTNTEPSRCQENNLEYDPQKNRELFVKMVIDNKSMLEHVDNPFLEEFARFLQPLYSHVTMRDVEKDCLTFYENEKAQLKEKITKLTSKVSLSVVGCCKPKGQRPIVSVAAHFIDNDFKFFNRIIGFVEVDDPSFDCSFTYGDAQVGFDAERILNDWGLGKKAFACTAKKYYIESADKSSRTLDVMCILECFRFIAELVRTEIWSDECSIGRIMEDLNECSEKMRYFNQIGAGHNLAPKSEFLVNTRGVLGIHLNILNDACTYKNVLCEFDHSNVGWSKVEEVVHLLNKINDVVVKLSSLEFPTSNLLLKFVFEISDIFLSEPCPVSSGGIQHLLYDYLARCDKIVLIASLLDPRFQCRLLKRYIGKIKASEEDFCKFFCSLYNEYRSESTVICGFDRLSQMPEMTKYFTTSLVEEGDANFDVLGWWKDNESEYPILSRMARDILAIPISSSLASGTESVEEIIDEILLSTVDTRMSTVLVCCNNWLRSGCSAGNSVASMENIIERRHLDQVCPEHSSKSCVHDEMKCQELLAKLVISSELPFHFVKSTWFIEWAKNLQPLYNPVDLVSIETKCLGFYLTEMRRFNDLLWNTFANSVHLKRVCFSIHDVDHDHPRGDVVYHAYYRKYIEVTAHFTDNDFNLVRRTIGRKITDIHYGASYYASIIAQIQKCMDNLGLHKKVLAFTTARFWEQDNAKKPLDWLNYGIGVIRLDCIVEYLLSNVLFFIWDELGEVFESIRKMIKFLAEDSKLNDQLATKFKINSPKLYLQLDDQRRWDTTLNMLSDALAYKDFFDAYKGYNERFPLCDNWNDVESAVKILKPIYAAVTVLSSSQFPTSNLFLKIVFEIHDALLHAVFNTNYNVINKGEFLDCLMRFSDIYLKDCNNILLVASLLDPRFKLTYLERYYTKHLSDSEEIEKCIGDIYIMFEIEHDGGMSELKRYLQEDQVEVRDGDFDVLRWWKNNQSNYPILSRIAKDILAIPVSSVPSELAFSVALFETGGTFFRFEKLQNQLGPRTLEALHYSYNWLSDASSKGKFVQKGEAIDLVEQHIPPSYQCQLRVCDFLSIRFFERMSEEIVAIGGARLTVKKMKRLINPTDWIPEDIMDCYIGILNNQGNTSGKILKLSIIDTWQLQSWGSSIYEPELCIEKGKYFLQNELVLLPIQVQSQWIVGVVNFPKKEFQILNSSNLSGGPYEETTYTLRLGIKRCIDIATLSCQGVPEEWMQQNVLNWHINVIPNLPQQNDRCSCGLFALKYMQLWDGSKLATEFTQDDIDLFRKEIAEELIFSEFNEMKDIQNDIKTTINRITAPKHYFKSIDIYGIGLTKVEMVAVQYVENVDSSDEIVKMNCEIGHLTLTGNHMKCLIRPTYETGSIKWINDEVLNCGISIMDPTRHCPLKVMVVNTYNTCVYAQPNIEKTTNKRDLKRWAESGSQFLNSDLVFFPINFEKQHWYVGVLNFKLKQFQILDSKAKDSSRYTELTLNLRNGIQYLISLALDTNEHQDITDWPVKLIEAPQQQDNHSCGLFALKYIELWKGDDKCNSSLEVQAELFRKQLVYQLIFSEKNMLKNVQDDIRKMVQT